MGKDRKLEKALSVALNSISITGPPRLREALDYALFPGGGRVRPKLCLAVFSALGGREHDLAYGAATAIEMLHAASLVHDDLPCFDDALMRRGKPTLHRVYGEDLAVLVGDGLIVGAVEVLVRSAASRIGILAPALLELMVATGASKGLVAGQAWEGVPGASMETIHRAKTGALFEAAAVLGALAAEATDEPWRTMGRAIGEAYQIADDLMDVLGDEDESGKTMGQDDRNGRLSAVHRYQISGAVQRLEDLVIDAMCHVPRCEGRDVLISLLTRIGLRLCPAVLHNELKILGNPNGKIELETTSFRKPIYIA